MKKKHAGFLVVLLLAAALPIRADVVTEWNMATLDYIKAQGISNHFGNRALAMVHVAMFDAANGIQRRYQPFLVPMPPVQSLPADVAAAAAAYTVLSGLYPLDRFTFEALYHSHLSVHPERGLVHLATSYGEEVGQAVLEWRGEDGGAEAGTVTYPDGTELGQWRRTDQRPPMLPGWGQVMPFAMSSQDQFRLTGPPELSSYEYARDYIEVKEIGGAGSMTRTPEQTVIARFWPAGIPRMWNLVAQDVAERKGYDLSDNARLFALLNLALADANIAGWDMKYYYGFWRPVTAVAFGNEDGNDGTEVEYGWASLIPAPPFPEYVSGHSVSCAAAATVLAAVTGSDHFAFSLTSEANPSLPPRAFTSFWAAAREAGVSRIFGGIHFNFSNVEGLEAGRSLARFVCESCMTPRTAGKDTGGANDGGGR